MTVKTIFGAVVAVAVGGAVLGFASKYRSDCCSDEAKQSNAVTAATSKENMVSHESECHGDCAMNDTSGATECCQTTALSKSISLSGKELEGECHGDCALGNSPSAKKCCQDSEKTGGIVAFPK